MKVLVTGANGYLGCGIIKTLLDDGNEVIATDFVTDRVDRRANCLSCNIFHVENPYAFFDKPEIILHLAWRDGFQHYSEAHIDDLSYHYHFLERMIKSGIKQVAVMGSMHEIGFFEGSIKEDTPCYPVTPYGISKNALRELIAVLAKQNNIVFQWLRGYYIVGNSQYGNSIFSKITSAEQRGDKEFPFTRGQNQFDFIDYDIFCRQVASTIEQKTINGIVEICSGRPEKIADRVEKFIDENNYNIVLKYGAFKDRPYDSKAVWGDNSKIEKIMNLDKNL